MSGQYRGLGSKPYRAPRPTIWAACAALIILAVTACASSAASTPTGPAPTPVSFGSGGHKPTLTGAGSTFVAPFFAVAFAKYHQQHPGVSISYAVVGSGAGITAFSAKQADFGASDVPMTASEQAAARGGGVTQVPDALGGEGVAYNLDLPAGARLHLTGPVLARIFLGQITSWNDPAITALNSGINLPDAPITVVHRSDSSGTTYIFTNYLSSIDPAWAAKVGTSKTPNWPGRNWSPCWTGSPTAARPTPPPTATSPSHHKSSSSPTPCSSRSPARAGHIFSAEPAAASIRAERKAGEDPC